jgi:hypothetical protein
MARRRRGWKSLAYLGLRLHGDINAVRRGPRAMRRRVARRVYGKAPGRLAARLFPPTRNR